MHASHPPVKEQLNSPGRNGMTQLRRRKFSSERIPYVTKLHFAPSLLFTLGSKGEK